MKKKGILLFLALVMMSTVLFVGCGQKKLAEEDMVTMHVAALKGPTGVGLAHLMQTEQAKEKSFYQFTLAGAPDEIVSNVANGSIDIAAVPTNLAATLYQKTAGKVQMIAINTYGTLYLLAKDDTITSMADLKGKTIGATGQGANPEYILNDLLVKNGLQPGIDVTIQYYTEHAELAALAAAGKVDIAMLPEPNVTAVLQKNADLKIVLDLTKEWKKVNDQDLVMGCFIVSKQFAADHKEQLDLFLEEAKKSIAYAQKNVDDTAKICAQLGMIPSEEVAKAAIPNCNLVFVTGKNMQKAAESYFAILNEANPQSIGGAMPDADFYYQP